MRAAVIEQRPGPGTGRWRRHRPTGSHRAAPGPGPAVPAQQTRQTIEEMGGEGSVAGARPGGGLTCGLPGAPHRPPAGPAEGITAPVNNRRAQGRSAYRLYTAHALAGGRNRQDLWIRFPADYA